MGSYTFQISNSDQDAPVFITDAENAFDQLFKNTSVANYGGVNFCLISESLQSYILANIPGGEAQGPQADAETQNTKNSRKCGFYCLLQTQLPPEALVVLVGQGMGHHPDQLLPRGLAGGGEVLGEVRGQDDDQDVTQELQRGRQERNQVSRVLGTPSPCTAPRDQGTPAPSGLWGCDLGKVCQLSPCAGQEPCAGRGHEYPPAPSLLPLTFSRLWTFFYLFFFCCGTPHLLQLRLSVRSTCYIPKPGLNRG